MFEHNCTTFIKVVRELGSYQRSVCSAKVINTMGDCSTMTMGNYYCTHQESANVFINYLFKQYHAQRKPEGYRWKIIMTDYNSSFESSDSAGLLAKALDQIAADSHIVPVKGWEGDDNFQIRIWEIEKGMAWQPTIDLPAGCEEYSVVEQRDGCSYNDKIKHVNIDSLCGSDYYEECEEW